MHNFNFTGAINAQNANHNQHCFNEPAIIYNPDYNSETPSNFPQNQEFTDPT